MFGFTLSAILLFNVPLTNGTRGVSAITYRVQSAWTFFSAIQDIFLACMMFFILDEKSVDILVDERFHVSYPVIDVINHKESLDLHD